MKVSRLLLSIGLASAAALLPHAEQALTRRDPDLNDDMLYYNPSSDIYSHIAKRANLHRDLVARKIEAWNSFTTPVSGLDACVILQALEFLAASLIEATESITTDAGTQVFVKHSMQGGPVVLDMRSMMIWQSILDRFKDQLQVTNAWSLKTQLQVASCYLGYSRQAGFFLKALFANANEFAPQSPVRCLMFDKIQALYISYNNVANIIYGGNQPSGSIPQGTQYLITGNFPNPIPTNFKSPYPAPSPNSRIRDYCSKHDAPEPSSGESLFQLNLNAWRCSDINQVPAVVFNNPSNAQLGAVPNAGAAPAPAATPAATPAPAADRNASAAAGAGAAAPGPAAAPAAPAAQPAAAPAAALAAARRDTFEGKADPKIEELGRKLGRMETLGRVSTVFKDDKHDKHKNPFHKPKKGPKKGPKKNPKKNPKKESSKKDKPGDLRAAVKEAINERKEKKEKDKKEKKEKKKEKAREKWKNVHAPLGKLSDWDKKEDKKE